MYLDNCTNICVDSPSHKHENLTYFKETAYHKTETI